MIATRIKVADILSTYANVAGILKFTGTIQRFSKNMKILRYSRGIFVLIRPFSLTKNFSLRKISSCLKSVNGNYSHILSTNHALNATGSSIIAVMAAPALQCTAAKEILIPCRQCTALYDQHDLCTARFTIIDDIKEITRYPQQKMNKNTYTKVNSPSKKKRTQRKENEKFNSSSNSRAPKTSPLSLL